MKFLLLQFKGNNLLRRIIFFNILAGLFFIPLISCKAGDINVVWFDDIDKAIVESNKEGKPILIHFTTDWCSWCRKIEADTYPDKRVAEKMLKFVNLKVNPEKSDENRAFASKYNVTGYPTILFLDKELKVLHRVGGYQGPDDFLKSIETALKSSNIDSLLAKYNKNNDPESGHELVEIYKNTQEYDKAYDIIKNLDEKDKINNEKKNEFYLLAGFTSMHNSRFEDALSYYQRVLDLNKGKDPNIYNQAFLYYYYTTYLNGNKAKAVEGVKSILASGNMSDDWTEEFNSFLSWLNDN